MAHRLTVVSAVAVPAPRLKALVSILQSSSNHPLFFLVPSRLGRAASNICSLPSVLLSAASAGSCYESRRDSGEDTGWESEEARNLSAGGRCSLVRSCRAWYKGHGPKDAMHSPARESAASVYGPRAAGGRKALRTLATRWRASSFRISLPLQIFRSVRQVPLLLLSVRLAIAYLGAASLFAAPRTA